MNRFRWYLKFMKSSIANRLFRISVALMAVALASTLTTSMMCVSGGTGINLGKELKAFGANLIILPADDGLEAGFGRVGLDGIVGRNYMKESSALQALDIMGSILKDIVFTVEGEALAGDVPVEIKGISPDALDRIARGWVIEGDLSGNLCSAGFLVAEKMGLKPGSIIQIEGREVLISAIFKSGSQDDGRIILPLKTAQDMLGIPGRISSILVNADNSSKPFEETTARLNDLFPEGNARIVRQITNAENSFLAKVRFLLILVTVVVLFATFISVIGTMSAMALERRKEVALMKAIGSSGRDVVFFYLGEAVFIGFGGGIAGLAGGFFLAQAISFSAFQQTLPFSFSLVPTAILTGLGVALVSCLPTLRTLLRVDPITVLRET